MVDTVSLWKPRGPLFFSAPCPYHATSDCTEKVHILFWDFEILTDVLRRLRALVAKRDWDEIAEVAKTKRSPIGWEVSNTLVSFSFSIYRNLILASEEFCLSLGGGMNERETDHDSRLTPLAILQPHSPGRESETRGNVCAEMHQRGARRDHYYVREVRIEGKSGGRGRKA